MLTKLKYMNINAIMIDKNWVPSMCQDLGKVLNIYYFI